MADNSSFKENIKANWDILFPKTDGESTLTANQAFDNWVTLSSGTTKDVDPVQGISLVPSALLDLLAAFGGLAENLANLLGLIV